MTRADVIGEGLFERADLRPTDVLTASQHTENSLFEVRAQIGDLLAEAEGWHVHGDHLRPPLRPRISRTSPVPDRDAISHCSRPKGSDRGSPVRLSELR